ncbi:MAG: segregation and condensation protein A, partial [Solirubrobacteraceae bacterium]
PGVRAAVGCARAGRARVPGVRAAVGCARYGDQMTAAALLELDLDVFSGPFDLLLTLVLREEVDLMELQVADVVLAYLDHLEQRGELDLESATEFILLIAALLELKSRLLIAGGEDDELLDIEPEEAAEELLARMIEARRFRAAGEHLSALLHAERGFRYRSAPLPAHVRKSVVPQTDGSERPQALAAAIGSLLRMPPSVSIAHMGIPRVSLGDRLAHLRRLLSRLSAGGSFSFEDAVRGADRATVAVTLFALLELYRRGEASWEQRECFGEISVRPGMRHPVAEAPTVRSATG